MYLFHHCYALAEVSLPNNLKKIGDAAFQKCSTLETLDLPNNEVEFGYGPFVGCDRLIELADKHGFLSSGSFGAPHNSSVNTGAGVADYLLERYKRNVLKSYVLLAMMRFNETVDEQRGSETEKIQKAKKLTMATTVVVSSSACWFGFLGWKNNQIHEEQPVKDEQALLVGEVLQCWMEGGGTSGILAHTLRFL